MQSLSHFAVFLLVCFTTAVLSQSATTISSVPITTPATTVNAASSSTPSAPESDNGNDDHNSDDKDKITAPTRSPLADQPKPTSPPLIHNTVLSSKPSTILTSKPSTIPSDPTEAVVGSKSNGSNSPMSDKKGANSGVSRVSIGFVLISVVALLISGTFS